MANNSNRKAIEFMVQGALPPHSTNVLWMDTSVPTLPVLKIFENGAWTTVHTEQGKVDELLAKTVLEQAKVIDTLTNGINTKLDTMREAYNNLSQAAEAYNVGKTQLAQAITSKGVETSLTESYPEMAKKVSLIVQAPTLDGESVTGQTIFPQPYVWNLIEEAYEHQNGEYAGLILAELYKGYDTIPLSGADAYYTCDGDFYDAATTHIWHDENLGRVNRYVIYYFRNAYSPFVIGDASVCPRRMTVLGKVGVISSAIAGRITNIYNCGEIQDIQFADTQPWNTNVFLKINQHSNGGIFLNNRQITNITVEADLLSGGYIVGATNNGDCPSLTSLSIIANKISGCNIVKNFGSANNSFNALSEISIQGVEELSGGAILYNNDTHNTRMSALRRIDASSIRVIKEAGAIITNNINKNFAPNLSTIDLSNLEEYYASTSHPNFGLICNAHIIEQRLLKFKSWNVIQTWAGDGLTFFYACNKLRYIYLDVLEYTNGDQSYTFLANNCQVLEYVYFGYEENDKTKAINFRVSKCPNLTDVELKNGYNKPINLSTYTSMSAANMYAHILQRLKQDEPDCGDGVTITLGQTNLDKLTSEESVQLLDDLTNIYGYTFA